MNTLLYVILTFCNQYVGDYPKGYVKCVADTTNCSVYDNGQVSEQKLGKCLIDTKKQLKD